nr:GAF domain-containing protein [Microcella alkalica]
MDLTHALQRIVEVGRELVGARYGALGVIAPDGSLERFLHSGLTVERAERIGSLPTGHGILGAVVTDARTIRLDRLADDPRSAGFPAHHPPMGSFLGVPIRVGGAVFGNLYLTERAGGDPFDEVDEALITTLAAMAGTAIANSRLYERAQAERRWLEASERVIQRLLAGQLSPDDAAEVAETVLAVSEARGVVLRIGEGDAELAATAGDALGDGPRLDVPLLGAEERRLGTLEIVRGPDGHPFEEGERETAERFARSVAIARELALSRIDEQRLALADERERIARDLHDHVIQSLFAIGLTLQSTVGDPTSPMGAKIAAQVDAIDATIRQIRQAIYRLSAAPAAEAYSLRARINTLVRQTLEGEDLDSRLEFSGPVDTLVDTSLGDEVAAVVREALSNAVRHARARAVTVSMAVRGAQVVITITDDGIGMPVSGRRSGLENLRARAVELGGTFAIGPASPRGTQLRWVVPWKAS